MAQPCTSAQGKFRYGGVDIDFGPYSRQVTFGRDSSNTVAVSSRKASRTHARIERRRDKLFLIDQSANGTFVRDDRGRETVLHLEEMVLHGRGLVSFGEPVAAGSKWLEYSVDDHAVSEEQPQRTGTAAG